MLYRNPPSSSSSSVLEVLPSIRFILFIHHSSFIIHHSSFTIPHSPFTIHYPPSTILHPHSSASSPRHHIIDSWKPPASQHRVKVVRGVRLQSPYPATGRHRMPQDATGCQTLCPETAFRMSSNHRVLKASSQPTSSKGC